MAKQLQLLRSKRGSLWEMCIGLEVHAQVLSKSKLMSGSAASTLSSALPNRQVSFFDAALPGTLPVVNKECVHQAIRTSLAVGAQVHARSVFERKHYFYCDLPLGYQLTQQRAPIATNGVLHFDVPASAIVSEHGDAADGDSSGDESSNAAVFDASKYKSRKEKNEALRKWKEAQQQKKAKATGGGDQEDVISRSVRIARIQIEQDSGKSIHDLEEGSTVVDLNRAGTALMEIVMEPDLRSPVEAGQVMKQLQHLLRHLGVCDGNMEEGSMRCDLNVSVRRADDPAFGERVEVKNMNSIRNMMRAAEFEARRQIELLENESDSTDASIEARIHRETRSFDAVTGETKRMRSKEGAKDYRFFPEPDLPPLVVQDEVIQALESSLPELPAALKERLMATYALTSYESSVLVNEAGAAAFFEQVASKQSRPSKLVVNWVLNDLFGHLKAANGDILSSPVSAQELGELIDLIVDGTISGKIAKDVLEILFYDNLAAAGGGSGDGADQKAKSPLQIVEEKNWKQIQSDDEVRALCRSVLDDPKTKKNLDAYVNGKTQLFGFFIGQVMKNSGGRVNPELANAVMQELLNEYTASNFCCLLTEDRDVDEQEIFPRERLRVHESRLLLHRVALELVDVDVRKARLRHLHEHDSEQVARLHEELVVRDHEPVAVDAVRRGELGAFHEHARDVVRHESKAIFELRTGGDFEERVLALEREQRLFILRLVARLRRRCRVLGAQDEQLLRVKVKEEFARGDEEHDCEEAPGERDEHREVHFRRPRGRERRAELHGCDLALAHCRRLRGRSVDLVRIVTRDLKQIGEALEDLATVPVADFKADHREERVDALAEEHPEHAAQTQKQREQVRVRDRLVDRHGLRVGHGAGVTRAELDQRPELVDVTAQDHDPATEDQRGRYGDERVPHPECAVHQVVARDNEQDDQVEEHVEAEPELDQVHPCPRVPQQRHAREMHLHDHVRGLVVEYPDLAVGVRLLKLGLDIAPGARGRKEPLRELAVRVLGDRTQRPRTGVCQAVVLVNAEVELLEREPNRDEQVVLSLRDLEIVGKLERCDSRGAALSLVRERVLHVGHHERDQVHVFRVFHFAYEVERLHVRRIGHRDSANCAVDHRRDELRLGRVQEREVVCRAIDDRVVQLPLVLVPIEDLDARVLQHTIAGRERGIARVREVERARHGVCAVTQPSHDQRTLADCRRANEVAHHNRIVGSGLDHGLVRAAQELDNVGHHLQTRNHVEERGDEDPEPMREVDHVLARDLAAFLQVRHARVLVVDGWCVLLLVVFVRTHLVSPARDRAQLGHGDAILDRNWRGGSSKSRVLTHGFVLLLCPKYSEMGWEELVVPWADALLCLLLVLGRGACSQ